MVQAKHSGENKENLINWTSSKLKLLPFERHFKKIKGQPPAGKYSQYTQLTKNLYVKYIKNSYNLRTKKHKKLRTKKSHNPVFKKAKDLTRLLHKRRYRNGQLVHDKISTSLSSKKSQKITKYHMIPTRMLMLILKRLTTASVGKGSERVGASNTSLVGIFNYRTPLGKRLIIFL